MAQISKNAFPYDSSMVLEDGAGAITSTAVASTAYLDLGAGVWSGELVIDVTAMDVASTNESYAIYLQGANTTNFSDLVVLDAVLIGADGATGEGQDSIATVYYKPVHNVKGYLAYRYVRLNVVVAGTSPSITFTAFLSSRS